jgi:hypothetical protein
MWLLLDEHDEANDKRLAQHIIAVHQGRVGAPAAAEGAAAGNQAGSSRQQQEGASTSGVSSSSNSCTLHGCVCRLLWVLFMLCLVLHSCSGS